MFGRGRKPQSYGYCLGLCFALVLLFIVELYVKGVWPGSGTAALRLTVIPEWEYTSRNNIMRNHYVWDAEVGCPQFRAKHRKEIASSVSNVSTARTPSLQGVEDISCSQLKLQHVSIRLESWTWLPSSMESLYSCRCGLTCMWTTSDVLADEPDVVLYETYQPPVERDLGQPLRAYLNMEPGRYRAAVQELFVSYHAEDDVQVTYSAHVFENRNHFVSRFKSQEALVYWSSSRCVPERQELAQQILPLLPIHSFGKCLNNMGGRTIASMYPKCMKDVESLGWQGHLHCAMSHYKFVLAIENTRTESYVTEKLFFALESGSVPIYFGAPNFLDFVPPHSVIDGFSFSSLEDLAAYVKKVADDPLLYAEYHAWRRCGVLGPYARARAISLDSLPCRLCEAASKLGGRNATVAEG